MRTKILRILSIVLKKFNKNKESIINNRNISNENSDLKINNKDNILAKV